ncbi:potassium and/or sodium efflux P-type ATPase [Amphibacillus marinus]|uniref:Potassium and/or sodium efflux P-type ATPase n=1 Tax=Amphibacillus marinus TaxID=872970 RepID=A0A1H8M439_9BACI|nr:HAD-IC family P-type ATPase [Amphibacillus marinus]SEO12105.1 potassium and/or sodium efflux P-type ATPase [Amphibacillus marinus]
MKNNIEARQQGFYQLAKEEVFKRFKVSPEKGLTKQEAQERLAIHGPNQIEHEDTPKWKLFLRQFNNMIIYILIVAAGLTFGMGHLSDSIIIGLVIIINACIGYYQEVNASNALEKIQKLLSSNATVIREGHRIDIPAQNIVPGDLVYLEAGDHVPADLRIVDADNLRIQESSLTGEADSIMKQSIIIEQPTPLADQVNMAFASSSITNGSGTGVVVATAIDTQIGQISTEVNKVAQKKTPLMKEIDNLGKGISYVIIGAAIALFIFGLFIETYSLAVLALAIVTMIVGSVPEGLPATTSVILAMGVSDMAKKNKTIVKTLPAVETLGSVDVIATDKTGTLTKNEMTVQDIYTSEHYYTVSGTGYAPNGQLLMNNEVVDLANDPELAELLVAGYLANDTVLTNDTEGWFINGEPTDGSFLTLYHKAFGLNQPLWDELDKIPFDSDYRYIAKLAIDNNNERKLFIKGSPDRLFPMAKAFDQHFDNDTWKQRVDALSAQGKRVVAVGVKDVDQSANSINHEDLTSGIKLVGIVGIIDPPREEVIEALKVMKQAGIAVKMITGDHPITAKAIGEHLGLADHIQTITGAEIDALSSEKLEDIVNSYQVFARTTPKNKLDIIEALQKSGKVTAMTGDGVNDAPALKKADIGIAMGMKGTDVAKESADMVLADDNFSTMAIAIREGRRIYENIKKSILFLLPTSFAEGLIIAFTILAQRDMPLQATQMLWINMVSAITIQFAFIFEPAEPGIMSRSPRKTGDSLMNKRDIWQMTYVSVLMALISLIAYDWLIDMGADKVTAGTMMVNIIVMSKIFYLFNIRTAALAFSKAFFTNKKAFLIIGIMLILQLILTYVPFMQAVFYTEPLTLLEWSIAIIAGIIVLLVVEIDKYIRLKLRKKSAV